MKKRMMTMMALMVFAVSGFATEIKYKGIDEPKDEEGRYQYLKNIKVSYDGLAIRKIKFIMLHDYKNCSTIDEIVIAFNTVVKDYNIPIENIDKVKHIAISYYMSIIPNLKNRYEKIIEFNKNESIKNYHVAFAYFKLKQYDKALPILLKFGRIKYALVCLRNINSISLDELKIIIDFKTVNNNPQIISKCIDIINQDRETNIENNIAKVKMFLMLSIKFPPSKMEAGTELEWAKVQVSLNNNIEKLQKIIKIQIELEEL